MTSLKQHCWTLKAAELRELGGYQTVSGKRSKCKLIRSGHLADLLKEDRTTTTTALNMTSTSGPVLKGTSSRTGRSRALVLCRRFR